MAKKNKVPTGKQARKMGYTSFSQETFTNDTSNVRANELFVQMLQIPKKVQQKVAKGKESKIKENDYYPTSLQETLQMEDLLNQSNAAVTDRNDTELMNALAEMREIIDWSKTRQWNYQWAYIIGVLLFIGFLWYSTSDAKKGVTWAKTELEAMKKADDATLQDFKVKTIAKDSANVEYYKNNIASYKEKLETATQKEDKKLYAGYIKDYEKSLKKYETKLSELRSAEKEKLHKIAIKECKETLKTHKGSHRRILLWTLFFILLIPAYIFAERPYGYMISKYRLESKILGWIRKVMFWIAGGFMAWAGALYVTETTTHWSDGSKTKDDDSMLIYSMKFILLLIAICIFVFTSVALMLYSTIVGLYRNYNLLTDARAFVASLKK